MATYRAQIAFLTDSALPRDAQVITPHYTGSDPTALANGLKTNLLANTQISGTLTPFTINIYDATGPKPHHPLATATNGSTPSTSIAPREVCLCLSYYATLNQPRTRGRVYLPNVLVLGGAAPGIRPSSTVRTTAMSFGVTLFKGLPSGVAPVVWSRKNLTAYPITNYWVDDEWDTVRSRGLRGTTRNLGTVP